MDHRQELKDAVNLLADLTEANTAALFLLDGGGQHLHVAAYHSFSRVFRQTPIRVGEGLVGYVIKHLEPVDVDRYRQSSKATCLYDEEEEIKAFLAMPVGEVGVLVIDTKKRSVFGEKDKKIVRDFANFIHHLVLQQDTSSREAMYGRILDLMYDVENAALGFSDEREYLAEVLDAGRRYTGLSMGFIFKILPGRKQYSVVAVEGPSLATMRGRSFPVSQGLVGWVMREGQPLTHSRFNPLPGRAYLISPEEPMRGYNTFVGVPLLAWRRMTGVWAFAGRSERNIEEEEERALQLAGHRLAATIEHYRLGAS